MLSDETALRQDVESYENSYIKPLDQTPEALAWYNLRHNVERRRTMANFFPLKGEFYTNECVLKDFDLSGKWRDSRDDCLSLQEFFRSDTGLTSHEAILERGWDSYAKYLISTGVESDRSFHLEGFEVYFRAPYIADDRRELSGLLRSKANTAVNHYRWVIALFEVLINQAQKIGREYKVRQSADQTLWVLSSAVSSRRRVKESEWEEIEISYGKTYRKATGLFEDLPAFIGGAGGLLRSRSSLHQVETLVWGENGKLVSAGVRVVPVDKSLASRLPFS
jgi:hypothetical protein